MGQSRRPTYREMTLVYGAGRSKHVVVVSLTRVVRAIGFEALAHV